MKESLHSIIRRAETAIDNYEKLGIRVSISWVELALELAQRLLESEGPEIQTQELDNGLWVAYEESYGVSSVGVDEASAVDAVTDMIGKAEPTTETPTISSSTHVAYVSGIYENPDYTDWTPEFLTNDDRSPTPEEDRHEMWNCLTDPAPRRKIMECDPTQTGSMSG